VDVEMVMHAHAADVEVTPKTGVRVVAIVYVHVVFSAPKVATVKTVNVLGVHVDHVVLKVATVVTTVTASVAV